jgi:putative colanic acid biosynthesis acetyltransferase WcaF
MTSNYQVRSNRPSPFSRSHLAGRALWDAVWLILFRPSPRPCHAWRRALLRLFGAKVQSGVRISPRTRIWAPWNLTLCELAVLGPDVDCYCVAPIRIGAQATVSQYCYLCAATHDFESPDFTLVPGPIVIEDQAWLCADVFVGPGVTIGQGTVVGARSSVFASLPAWKICHGSPAKIIRDRVIKSPASGQQ